MKKKLMGLSLGLLIIVVPMLAGADTAFVPVSYGMQGASVLRVQQFLSDRGFLTAPFGGYYGAVTAAAVGRFQASAGISPLSPGTVGPKTLAAIARANAASVATSIPAAATLPAAQVSATSAVLEGSVAATAAADSATPSFLYGTSMSYGSTAEAAVSNGTASATVSGLECGTEYHFRISATNSAGTSNGGDATFTTLACGR